MTLNSNANEINITRIYDAPVKAVWDAWTDTEQVAQWWGPRGFTLTTHGRELKPGGFWNYTMHGPDGVDYPNKTVYFEVEDYKKLVYDHGANDDQPPLFRVTVLFTEIDGKTKMDMTMACATPEAASNIKQFIKKAGGNATWDRLAEFIAEKNNHKNTFVINRSFDTDIETMFDLWMDPKHVAEWSGPTGSHIEYLRTDMKEGGSSFYYMTMGETKLFGRAEYLKVNRPNLIVYTQQFCDADENITRHPMAPTWPETMLTTVLFTSESKNQTRITLTWEVYGDATAEEFETFTNGKPGMTLGWTGSFDKLENYIMALPVGI